MNTYWSTYVQKTEELYNSRALKFHRGNIDKWVNVMQIQDGMKILEVGCAGGLLCHKIKEYLPNIDITGSDFDLGHIEYAKKKSEELNISCNFIAGDATALPFNENTFDVCYSHTVINFCEPELFIGEQYRVLKTGGKIIILCVINSSNKPEEWIPTDECEEKNLFDKVWQGASQNPKSDIKKYENSAEKYFEYIYNQGFKNILIDTVATIKYAPDCDNISHDMAIAQINDDRLSELCSVEKAYIMAPEALIDEEYSLLRNLINRRYDKRIEQYEKGKKSWEFRVATTLVISGTK